MPSKLEQTLEKSMVPERFSRAGSKAHQETQTEIHEVVKSWYEVLTAMLNLEPAKRWTCKAASEHLGKVVRSEEGERNASPSRKSPAHTRPTSTGRPTRPAATSAFAALAAPEGPHEERNKNEMSSPDRYSF